MSPASIILRIVLSLSLVLNGGGFAMASTGAAFAHQMQPALGDVPAAPVAGVERTMDSTDCHQPDAKAELAPGMAVDDSQREPGGPGHAMSDCCQADSCSASCMQLVQAVVSAPVFQPAALLQCEAVLFKLASHAAPAVPHLIRPPIA